MKTDKTVARESLDDKLNEALEANDPEGGNPASNRQRRQWRIDEYEEQMIESDDPYAAMIGPSTGDLQQVLNVTTGALIKALGEEPTIEVIREFSPDIKLALKLRDAVTFDYEAFRRLEIESTSGTLRDGKIGGRKRPARLIGKLPLADR